MAVDTSLADYYSTLEKLLSKTDNDKELFEMIVNAPFHNKLHTTHLDLGIVVLLLADKKEGMIRRIALSDTEPARWAVKMTPVSFHQINIPINHKVNIISKAIRTGRAQKTADWKYLFTPVLSSESARFNQAGAGIACSFVYPLIGAREGGAMIFSFYQPIEQINLKHRKFMQSYSEIAAKALHSKS